MLKKIIFLLLIAASVHAAEPTGYIALGPPSEQLQESLDYRRIISLWQTGDYSIAKQHIQSFLNQFPKSPYTENIVALRGRIAAREGLAEEALADFEALREKSLVRSVQEERFRCLYQLERYTELMRLSGPTAARARGKDALDAQEQLCLFFHTEACFRSIADAPTELAARLGLLASCYERLNNSPFAGAALHSLAEAYENVGDQDAAAGCYERLALRCPRLDSYALYRQALHKLPDHPEVARSLLQRVIQLGKAEVDLARRALVILEVQLGQYAEAVAVATSGTELLEADDTALCAALAEAHIALGHHADADQALRAYFSGAEPSHPTYATLLDAALDLAVQDQNGARMEELERALDPVSAAALVWRCREYRAALANRNGQPKEALELLTGYGRIDLSRACRAGLLLEEAHAQRLCEDWARALYAYRSALKIAPVEWRAAPQAWKGLAEMLTRWCLSEQGSELSRATLRELRKLLVRAHQELDMPAQERLSQRLTLALRFHALQENEAVLQLLEDQSMEGCPAPLACKVHSLLFRTHSEMGSPPELLQRHANRALAQEPEPALEVQLRQSLFQALLALDGQQPDAREQAAEQLEQLLELCSDAVSPSQRLWLAHFYAQTAFSIEGVSWRLDELLRLCDEEANERAFALYSSLVYEDAPLSPADYLAWARSAYLLGASGPGQTVCAQVESFLEDGPSWVRAEIKCLQACLCIDQGLYSHLADIRAELLNLSQKVEDCLQANRYRLIVTQLHLQEPLEDGLIGEQYIEESRRLLDSVIGLQDPATQALRWESAFLRADLASLQTQQDALLSEREALQRAQQDFVLERQAHTLTHSDWRTLQPEGCSLFDAYMLLIEARIAWTDTRLAWREGREGEALAHQQLTESLLESLLNEERYTLSPFLREQARSGLQALQTVPQGQASTQELTWSSLPLQTHLGGSQQ